jgi:hypothetical protein
MVEGQIADCDVVAEKHHELGALGDEYAARRTSNCCHVSECGPAPKVDPPPFRRPTLTLARSQGFQ